ncbi:tyrosine-type recombinase/integrase [Chloroflexota bacterium]
MSLIDSSAMVNCVQQALRRLARKTGILQCHPHIFRHTFATIFITGNGSPPIPKEIMGHKSFQTTEKYIHPKADDLNKAHEFHSPIREVFKKRLRLKSIVK